MEKRIIVSWGFDQFTGEKYLDNFYVIPSDYDNLRIKKMFSTLIEDTNDVQTFEKDVARIINMIKIRSNHQHTHVCLFKIECDNDDIITRDFFETYIKYTPTEQLLKARI